MTFPFLQGLTTLVLLAVIVALGWIIAASYAPEAVHWVATETEVIVILVLLAAGLLLVSVVALLHTRSRDLP